MLTASAFCCDRLHDQQRAPAGLSSDCEPIPVFVAQCPYRRVRATQILRHWHFGQSFSSGCNLLARDEPDHQITSVASGVAQHVSLGDQAVGDGSTDRSAIRPTHVRWRVRHRQDAGGLLQLLQQ